MTPPMISRIARILLISVTAALMACASPYLIVLKDGTEIHSRGEPDFDDRSGFYRYESVDGREHQINKDEVKAIRAL